MRRFFSWIGLSARREAAKLRKERDELRAALDELVYLKDLKDASGKTAEYAARQPLAWAAAREAIGREAVGMLRPIGRIEINFPCPVHLTAVDERRLDIVAGEICDRWRLAHPDRTMWPAGHGSKITYMPMTRAEEEAGRHIEFDDEVYAIDCAERERYDSDSAPQGTTK